MSRNDHVVGIDLGGTKLAAAVFRVDDGGVHFERALAPITYEQILDTADAGRLTAEVRSQRIETRMAEAVKELRGAVGGDIAAVGVATAGFVEKGLVVEGHNTGMKNYPLQGAMEADTGTSVYLYKDSWAPVFALGPGVPSIIFSVGTGFGGVSAEADMTIRLRSYSASQKLIWIPFLYCNDDPGYAVSFGCDEMCHLIRRANEDFERIHPGQATLAEPDIEALASAIKKAAQGEDKISPSRLKLMLAKRLAKDAAMRMQPKEVYADFTCASTFPALIYEKRTGQAVTPKELDALAASGDYAAMFAYHALAEFVGYVLFKMQEERKMYGLSPAERVYGTGSGYNEVTGKLMGERIVAVMREHGEAAGLIPSEIGRAELLHYTDGDTTLACYGAAVGAARGMRV